MTIDQDQPAPGPVLLSEDIEAVEIEGEIRAAHQPILHMGTPCPSGTCCSCGAEGGCEAGTLIVMLDTARAEAQRHSAERNALVAFVEGIRDKIVPEGDEAAYLNALKWAAPIVLRSAKSLTVPTPAAPVAQPAADAGEEPYGARVPGSVEPCDWCGIEYLVPHWCSPPADQPAGGEHGSE